jgi:uncharacterized protein YqeY
MTLTEQINKDIKDAMRAREKEILNSLRAIKSALLLEATKGNAQEISKDTELKILQKLHKQRLDAYKIYVDQGREDLAENEKIDADVIARYLPVQMDREELLPLIEALITQTGAQGPKDMGRVMGLASKEFSGKAPGRLVADLVKEILNR